MRFALEQHIAGPPQRVAEAFTDPELYAGFVALPKLGAPAVLDRRVEGDIVRMQIRYRFTGELSAAARAAIDPAKLTWVEHSTHDLGTLAVEYRLVADHYRDRLRCTGGYQFAEAGDRTVRRAWGDLSVRAPLVGRVVEQAIVSGLREHLDAERALIEQFVAARRDPGG